ncbi:S1 family peptidase [Paraburkholderia sp. ZP32-5]|uniref:S1 family peptidase n=1 Tax=Paraburkholderia sp. ZP32-5 TaxID=2883245 RepID=UPI001F3C5F8F|nr:serine protease [Paraburkholderia sp. ZP32-5]
MTTSSTTGAGAWWRLAAAAIFAVMAPVGATLAQTTTTREEPMMIPPSKPIDAFALESNATGFFVNDNGDVLTARHVVEACQSLFLIKDAQVARATVKAVSKDHDLAVITSRIKPFLNASFAKTDNVGGAQPVFTAGYEVLRHMPDRATTMYNAVTLGKPTAQTGEFSMMSSATNGASGSAVLDQGGLVVGLVTDRSEASNADPRAYVTRAGAADYVVAVSADSIKAFLAANGIPFTETDTVQLELMQAHAPRAATLEAGVLCGG